MGVGWLPAVCIVVVRVLSCRRCFRCGPQLELKKVQLFECTNFHLPGSPITRVFRRHGEQHRGKIEVTQQSPGQIRKLLPKGRS